LEASGGLLKTAPLITTYLFRIVLMLAVALPMMVEQSALYQLDYHQQISIMV